MTRSTTNTATSKAEQVAGNGLLHRRALLRAALLSPALFSGRWTQDNRRRRRAPCRSTLGSLSQAIRFRPISAVEICEKRSAHAVQSQFRATHLTVTDPAPSA